MNKTLLKKYAKLIVTMGSNLEKGQGVIINCPVEQHEFAKLVAKEAYAQGAGWVRIDWGCQEFTKMKYKSESVKTLSKVETWEEEKMKFSAEALPAMIHIASADPDGLKGVDPVKMQKSNIARMKVLKPYRDMMDDKYQWTIVAVPCEKWAKKVFPEEKRTSKAIEMLWEAILMSVRVTKDNDPVKEWQEHNAKLQAKYRKLNDMNFDYLHYTNKKGTDFKCWLIDGGKWNGGGDYTQKGTFFNPNMPTEEVFTSPLAGKAEGVVYSTKPLSYNGQLIDEFFVRFENGAAVEWGAEKGKEALDMMMGMDEGAKKLGELALIPYHSPISDSGILFYNTLFDENASCHVALGRGFASTLENSAELSKEEQKAAGINDSLIHVDFMIGSEDMNIDGYTRDGKMVPVFRNGDWAI